MSLLPPGRVPYGSGSSRPDFERKIAREPDEIAAAFDLEGTMVISARRGRSFEVDFTEEEADLLAGTVVTHNHPQGGPLSGEDARFAADFDLAEMRAVLPNHVVYSIARPPRGWPIGEAMQEAAERCIEERFAENDRRSGKGTMKMSGIEAEVFLFESQRNAFREIGVELRRTNVWE